MLKPTFITGMARLGTQMRQATIRIESTPVFGGTAIRRSYVCTTMGGATFDPWSAKWRTLRASRNAAAAAIYGDGRLSSRGPGLFAYTTASITKRDGTLMGAEEDFGEFVLHMLGVSGDVPWRGETVEDRMTISVEVISQDSWLD